MWSLNAAIAVYAMNTFVSPSISGFLPFDLGFVCKPPDLFNLAFPPSEQLE